MKSRLIKAGIEVRDGKIKQNDIDKAVTIMASWDDEDDDVTHKYGFGDKILYLDMGNQHEATIVGLDKKNGRPIYILDNNKWTYEQDVMYKVK